MENKSEMIEQEEIPMLDEIPALEEDTLVQDQAPVEAEVAEICEETLTEQAPTTEREPSAVTEAPRKAQPQSGWQKTKVVLRKIDKVMDVLVNLIFRLRKVIMAAPVVYYAVKLAMYNQEHLPEQVGINLQSTGEFAQYISRNLAVMGPLALTASCLILMFCSRKAMYSWAISVFTLALPLLILISNLYPA